MAHGPAVLHSDPCTHILLGMLPRTVKEFGGNNALRLGLPEHANLSTILKGFHCGYVSTSNLPGLLTLLQATSWEV